MASGVNDSTANQQAFVTLATNDDYCLGALVLCHSLRQVKTTRQVVCMTSSDVSNHMSEALSAAFDQVISVDVLSSNDPASLALLGRPNLGVTFTKIHCWRLTQFEKCVFLDADTLVLQNCDELFEREEFSAAPDPGWPDCFNSGVFVYRPSQDTYTKLVEFSNTAGSFDGGDQGLLNLYFCDWAYKNIDRHLPFLYNVVSQAFYSYLPAFRRFGAGTKICHFIGATKPWHHAINESTGLPVPDLNTGFSEEFLSKWWMIFRVYVLPRLNRPAVSNSWHEAPLGESSVDLPPDKEAYNLRELPVQKCDAEFYPDKRSECHEQSVTIIDNTTKNLEGDNSNGTDKRNECHQDSVTVIVNTTKNLERDDNSDRIDKQSECYEDSVTVIVNTVENVERDDSSNRNTPVHDTLASSDAIGQVESAQKLPLSNSQLYKLCSEWKAPYENIHYGFDSILSRIKEKMESNPDNGYSIFPFEMASSDRAESPRIQESNLMPQLLSLSLGDENQQGKATPSIPTELHQAMWEKGVMDYTGVDSFDNIKKHIDTKLSTPGTTSTASSLFSSPDVRPKTDTRRGSSPGSDTDPKQPKQPKKSALKKPKQ